MAIGEKEMTAGLLDLSEPNLRLRLTLNYYVIWDRFLNIYYPLEIEVPTW